MNDALAQVGESWAGYTIVEVLGSNSIAERYRVRADDGGLHLLEVLAVRHPALLDRLREAELHRVVHPNLLSVHDVVSVLRFPAVVTANTSGEPLSRWIKRSPSREDRLRVFHGIASAVAELHRYSIPHGMLHPDLILIEERRGRAVARVELPGVATVVYGILREGGAMSSSGASLGSPAFQSPEQLRAPDRTTLQCDLFTLGCLLYFVLAGRSPFAGLDPMSCFEAARSETYPPLYERASDVPPEIQSLVTELLRADPELRPSADDIVDRVDPFVPEARWRWLMPVLIGALFGMLALATLALLIGLLR